MLLFSQFITCSLQAEGFPDLGDVSCVALQVITKPSALWVPPLNVHIVIVISAAGFGGTHRYSICYTMAVTKHTITPAAINNTWP